MTIPPSAWKRRRRAYLFVGGPWHGQWEAIPVGRITWNVPIRREEVLVHIPRSLPSRPSHDVARYRRECVRSKSEPMAPLDIFVLTSIGDEDLDRAIWSALTQRGRA